jgi:phosphoglycolate phosphatase-like HAD superfamily hydrolase
VFVGDTIWDVQACKEAGLACIALLTGGVGRDELREAGAAEIYESPAELLTMLADSLLAR